MVFKKLEDAHAHAKKASKGGGYAAIILSRGEYHVESTPPYVRSIETLVAQYENGMRHMPDVNPAEEKEMQEGEIFLGNTDTEDWPGKYAFASDLKTLRIGEQAYDIYGDELAPDYCRPLFIHKSEYDKYEKLRADKHRRELAELLNKPMKKR